jgi:membrane-associated phospholipid phosphatase
MGFVVFGLLAALVETRVLAGLDLATARANQALAGELLYLWSALAGLLVSAEFSLGYAALMSLLLWLAGCGRWSLAPFAFLLLVPIELALKLTLEQPPVPPELRRSVYYPLTSLRLPNSFPSGHALRTGFFCVFWAALLWSRGGSASRFGVPICGLLAGLLGFARIYLGQHWLSDVIAGLLLGGALALLVAEPLIRRLAAKPAVFGRSQSLFGTSNRVE